MNKLISTFVSAITLLVLIYPFQLSADTKIDSLENLIQQAQDVDKILLMNKLFNELFPSKIEKSIRLSEEMLLLARSQNSENGLSKAYRTKAHIYNYQSKYDSLRIVAKQGLAYATAKADSTIFYNFLGMHQERVGTLDSAIFYYKKVIKIGRDQLYKPYNNIARVYQQQSDYLNSIDYLNLAMVGAREAGNINAEAVIANNLANSHFMVNDTTKGIAYYKKSIALKDQIGDERGKLFALIGLSDRSRMLEDRKKYRDMGKEIAEKIAHKVFIAHFTAAQAETHIEEGRYDQAIDILLLIYEARKTNPSFEFEKILEALCDSYLGKGELMNAKKFALELERYAAAGDVELLQMARGYLLEIYEARNDHTNYFDVATKFYKLKDSLETQSIIEKLSYTEGLLDVEQQEKVALLNLTIQQKERSRFIWGLLGLVSTLLTMLILYHRNRRIKAQKETIEKEKTLVEQESARLKEMDEFKSRFYTNITHEFRTPLTVITGIANQLKGNEEQKDLIKRNSHQLLNLVNQMLELRKIESGAVVIKMKQGDIIKFLRYLTESLISYAEAQGILLHFISDEESLMMDFDAEIMTRLHSNLLSNAIKFTPNGGNIYVQLDANSNKSLSITVRDTGVGIPEEKLPYIFERFYQVDDSSTRKGEGTGIGLTLVAQLVKAIKGDIQVKSKAGKGATFSILLPVRNDALFANETEWGKDKSLAAAHSVPTIPSELNLSSEDIFNADKPRVLIVEDNADVIHYLIVCLKEFYDIEIAMNGEEGIDKALEETPDLIVSDVMMPKKDGFELCQSLKTDERTSHIPIVLLTAKADMEARLQGLGRGADAYLSKPFHEDELQLILKNLLAVQKRLQSRFSQVSDDTLSDPEAKRTDDNIVQQHLEIENAFLQKIRGLVEKELSDADFGMPQLMRGLGMSRSQIYKKVKALTGHSPSRYTRSIRLHHAQKLLQTTDLNVSEVAYDVGFSSPFYFSDVFFEEFGIRPNETRK